MPAVASVHFNTERTWRGGEQQTLYLVQGLNRRGHPATLVASPASELYSRAQAAGLGPIGIHSRGEVDARAVARLAALLWRLRPSILHLHTSHAHLLGALAAAVAPPLKRVVSRRVDFSIYRHSFLRLNWIKYRYGVDRYIAVSSAVEGLLAREGVDPGRIRVVRSGVDPLRFAGVEGDRERLLHELGLPPGLPLVVSVGALAEHKGHRFLVEAAPEILESRDAAFAVLGGGPRGLELVDAARCLGVAHRFRFLGFRNEVGAVIAAASCFVFPSLEEGLGTSILDALLLERPVVATQAGGIPEVIGHGQEGVLVPPGDSGALARAILDLLADPQRAQALGRRGRERVLRDFTADRMVEETLAVYREVLG